MFEKYRKRRSDLDLSDRGEQQKELGISVVESHKYSFTHFVVKLYLRISITSDMSSLHCHSLILVPHNLKDICRFEE